MKRNLFLLSLLVAVIGVNRAYTQENAQRPEEGPGKRRQKRSKKAAEQYPNTFPAGVFSPFNQIGSPTRPQECEPQYSKITQCDRLAELACHDENQPDGTFKFDSKLNEKNKKKLEELDGIVTELIGKLMDRFSADQAADPQQVYFKELMIGYLGLSPYSDCKDAAEKKPTQSCVDRVRSLLGASLKREFDSLNSDPMRYLGRKRAGSENQVSRQLELLLSSQDAAPALEEFISKTKKSTENIKTQEKIEGAIKRVKKSYARWILENVPDPDIAKALARKVEGISFKGFDCSALFRAQIDGSTTDDLSKLPVYLIPNAYYDPGKNHFRYCNGLAQDDPSLFQVYHTIAHELAHAMSPCNLEKEPFSSTFIFPDKSSLFAMERDYPVPGLIACLRSKETYGAKRGFAHSPQSTMLGPHGNEDEAPFGSGEAEGGTFCSPGDQAGESVSDFIANSLLPGLIESDVIEGRVAKLQQDDWTAGFSNTFRFMKPCEDPVFFGDPHPKSRLRANQLGANPEVRKLMGCDTNLPKGVAFCNKATRERFSREMNSVNQIGPPTMQNVGTPSGPGHFTK